MTEVTDVAGGGSNGEIQPFSIAAPPGTQVGYVKTYTYYLYDENGNVLCELDKDGNITAKYLYGNGLIAKRTAKAPQSTYFYHQDPVGSIIMLTDYQGNILKQYKYTAFGTIMDETGSLNNDVKFVGKEQDRNGLYSFPARYYSPGLGRFTTTDPIREVHRSYAYAMNNPLTKTDPSGALVPYERQPYTYMDILWHDPTAAEIMLEIMQYNPFLQAQPSSSDITMVNSEVEGEGENKIAWNTVGWGALETSIGAVGVANSIMIMLNPASPITAYYGFELMGESITTFGIGIYDIGRGFMGEKNPFIKQAIGPFFPYPGFIPISPENTGGK